MKRSRKPRSLGLRTGIQIFFFALIALISVNHSLAEAGQGLPFLSTASLHALCPFGGVVSVYQVATVGTFVQKIHDSSFILMILVFLLALLAGPVFCGWVCPLGSLQEWLGGIGRKLFKRRRYNHFIPARIDHWLRFLRYGVLAWSLYMTAVTGKLVFAEVDPYHALFNFWTSELAIGGLAVLGLTLAGSLFVERPWCKYACPYGALLGMTNWIRVFRIQRQESTCKLDRACDRVCPMNINVSGSTAIRDHQCISCLKCTSESICPVAGTVELAAGRLKTFPVELPAGGLK